MDGRFILVEGARQNNLKDVGVRVPVGAVTAVTGVAGAGKSSLAFDVLHAEGYRRYVETFSPYARQFLERLDRPAADRIEGVLPSLAIDRTAPVRTSRSTVGTMTSIADYLRALWARAAVLHCKNCGQAVLRDSPSSIFAALVAAAEGKQALLCFPCRVGRVSPKALRETLQEAGFRRLLEDGGPVALEDAELRAHDGVVTVVPHRHRPRQPAAHRRFARGGAPLREGARRAARRRSPRAAPLQRSSPLRPLRSGLLGPDAGALLLQQSGRRLRDVQGIRADDGDRPRPGRPRSAAFHRGGMHQAIPDALLRRLPAGPAALPEAPEAAGRRALGRAQRNRPAHHLGRRARRTGAVADALVRHRRVLRVARIENLPDARPGAAF